MKKYIILFCYTSLPAKCRDLVGITFQIQAEYKRSNIHNVISVVSLNVLDLHFQVYKKPVFKEDSYLELYRKSKKVFNSRQLQALQRLYQWRDKLGRMEDESTG